ncbi:MAG: UDP-N-acetylglucosamine--N-acetylmuramyl-(pentapeptide) pyrophosphoryl-undecaprenol N-acetylglucosamine transferase [Candidatus Staskawiczbacteria bacterium]|nr:UDP-N-acetylglucosamine--N-acetylmuramyl-(pentapeptide) pyrophosphoryl-undecaprenol N-acetylglucosamine transferase [Candidatus Staskawiczbacteria bacterium]
MRILFTGGGTGGHVYPLVAIAREIRRIYPKQNLEFYYLGPKDELGLILLSQEDFIIKTIISGKVRRYFSLQNFVDILFKIPFGILQTFFMMLQIKPDLVFSKGGSGSISVTYPAKLLKIPVFIHESDVVPGLSNQQTSKWAKKVFTSFPKTEYFEPEKIVLTGNPIRKEITEGDKQIAGDLFNLTFSKPIFLIVGGSQGAGAVNDFVLRILNDLLKKFEIIHVTGRENIKQVEREAQVVMNKDLEKYYHPIAFLDEEKTKHAYAAADLVISRSGSSAIFEIAACGKPSILIPLPTSAGDHQSKNAYVYANAGACIVLEQENLTPNIFMENVELLLLHSEKVEEMKQSAFAFAKPLAARAIAREILEFLMLD